MPRKLLVLLILCPLAIGLVWRTRPSPAQPATEAGGKALRAAAPLPISQVILFSSGVGYYQREGEVTGSTRVDLTFPGADVNDLLKSLVLQDRDGGSISTITYDSPDPVDKTLKSFALDLTYNPTFGQILNQARGEKIEVTVRANSGSLPATLTGTIVGMEMRREDAAKAEMDVLNLLAADGMQSILLAQMQRVRFLNAALDSEFKRALEVLAATHDTEKKVVSLGLKGDGKRRVRVGYVVEHPIWKTSYRLVLHEQGKPFLQGWAIVENPSDEDWKDVRLALVSGRPISYQMDLYQPLYIPRPKVEPELFASLRPPVFSGAITGAGQSGGLVNLGVGGGQLGSQALGGFQFGGLRIGGLGLGGGFGSQGGMGQAFNPYQRGPGQYGQQGGFGVQGAGGRPAAGNFRPAGGGGDDEGDSDQPVFQRGKITYEELQKRIQQQQTAKAQAKKIGSELAAVDPKEGVGALASAQDVGDRFKYVVDDRVSLARQKSGLLPIINQDVEAGKVSVFNEAIHAKFPVLSLRLKNTAAHPLTQGPVTVYEEGNYAGDARLLDLQANEERLLGYALDLGMEVKAEAKSFPQKLTALKIQKGVLQATNKLRQTRTYLVMNRAKQGRLLLIEHPVRPDWKLALPEKPAERTREVYRFQTGVPAGKGTKLEVAEERTFDEYSALTSASDEQLHLYLSGGVASPRVKEALNKAITLEESVVRSQRDLGQRTGELNEITTDQERLRANLKIVPQTSAAYKRYLDKFDTQETEIERLRTQVKQLQADVKAQQAAYEKFLAELTVE